MAPTLHVIEYGAPGRLATMAHPRGGDWAAGLRAAGVDVVVSALTPAESATLGLTEASVLVGAAGMEFVSFPIADFGVPAHDHAGAVAERLAAAVRDGRFVVVHCWGGIGRSSLLAGAVLVRLGAAPAEAWELITAARGRPVPETPEQRDWLVAFARGMPNNR